MRMLLTVLLLAVLALSSARAAEPVSFPLHETPRPLPALAFIDGEGQPRTLENFRDKVVLLNIWATWCGPCRHEMPTLDRLQARLGGEDFQVVALSIDRAGLGAVREFFDEINIAHLRIFIDESGRAARDLKTFGLPTTLLIGSDGYELGRFVGPAEWDTPELIAFFKSVIAKHTEKGTKP